MGRKQNDPYQGTNRRGYPTTASNNNISDVPADNNAQTQILQGQLTSLRAETVSSRNTYGLDIVTVRDCLNQLGEHSPIAVAYANKISQLLSEDRDDLYVDVLAEIDNTHV